MNIKQILDEVKDRGDKMKAEIMNELVQSKVVQQIVTNKSFVHAVSRVIRTTDDVKKVIQTQVKHVFNQLDVPTQKELKRIAKQIGQQERLIQSVGKKKVPVTKLRKTKKKASGLKKKKTVKKKATKKTATKKKAVKKKTVKKKAVRKTKAK